jgi:hypothetical protein
MTRALTITVPAARAGSDPKIVSRTTSASAIANLHSNINSLLKPGSERKPEVATLLLGTKAW